MVKVEVRDKDNVNLVQLHLAHKWKARLALHSRMNPAVKLLCSQEAQASSDTQREKKNMHTCTPRVQIQSLKRISPMLGEGAGAALKT